MTTPADNTPYAIIVDALTDCGKLQEGDEVVGERLASCMRRLRDLVNYFTTKGVKLWLQSDQAITLVAGQGGPSNPYTLKPGGSVSITKPLRATDGYYLDANSISRPVDSIARADYVRLGNKTQQGAINSYFVDKQQSEIDIYTWLVPDTTAALGTLHVILRQQATDPVTLNETMNFPQEWRIALRWCLADEMSTGQPAEVIKRCMVNARMYREELENWDIEDVPTQFTPDQQGTGNRSFL